MKCLLCGCHRERESSYLHTTVWFYRPNSKRNRKEKWKNSTKFNSNAKGNHKIKYEFVMGAHTMINLLITHLHVIWLDLLLFFSPVHVWYDFFLLSNEKKNGTQSLITVLISMTAFSIPHEITKTSIHLFGKIYILQHYPHIHGFFFSLWYSVHRFFFFNCIMW